MTLSAIAYIDDYRTRRDGTRNGPPQRAAWPMHHVLQASHDAQVYNDGKAWLVDGNLATASQLRAIADLLTQSMLVAVSGDVRIDTRHPGADCDSWLDLTSQGRRLLARWGQFTKFGSPL